MGPRASLLLLPAGLPVLRLCLVLWKPSSSVLIWRCVPRSVIGPTWGHVKMLKPTQCLAFIRCSKRLLTESLLHDNQWRLRISNLAEVEMGICIILKNEIFLIKEWGFGGLETPSLLKLLGTFLSIKTARQGSHSYSSNHSFIHSTSAC